MLISAHETIQNLLVPTKDLMKKYHDNSQLVDSIVAAKDIIDPHIHVLSDVHVFFLDELFFWQLQERDNQFEFNPDCPVSGLHYHGMVWGIQIPYA